MRHSCFMITSIQLDYPVYIAFNGLMSVPAVYEHETVCTIVRHLTNIDLSEFSIVRCSSKDFKNALIKIDFTFK